MDRPTTIALSGLVLGVSVVSIAYKSSSALDQPIHSASMFLAIAGLSILSLVRFWPGLAFLHSPEREGYITRLGDLPQPSSPRHKTTHSRAVGPEPSDLRVWGATFVASTIAIVLRGELFRRALLNPQCAWPGVEGALPLLLAVYDALRNPRRSREADAVSDNPFDHVVRTFTHGRTRNILPALLLSWGCVLFATTTSGPRSTYICPAPSLLSTPTYQILGLLLDGFIVFSINGLFGGRGSRHAPRDRRGLLIIAWIFLLSALLLSIGDAFYFHSTPRRRHRFDLTYLVYLAGLIWPSIFLTAISLAALRCLSQIGPIALSMVVVFVTTYAPGIADAWFYRNPFPPFHSGSAAFSVFLICAGAAHLLSIDTPLDDLGASKISSKSSSSRTRTKIFGVLVLGVVYVTFQPSQTAAVWYHPVDRLIAEAREQQDAWLKQAYIGRTLGRATSAYRARYKRHPPPGFDRWYDYAKARASIIIDDFDSIHEDLLPFWSLSPAELRSRTWEVTSNPWNEISSISIRNGTAAVGPNTLPTHRWMLEGVRDMIAPFAEHLPDMDIAMNLNDECRVAVQWEHAEAMRQLGRDAGRLDEEKDGRWSSDRAQGWEEAPPEQITHSRFEDLSFSNTFHSYGAATCPPGSPARTRRVWDTRRLCASCAEPHSAGAFVRSWTAAADICHQPDLADLHGFFLSPAAFKGTHELMPVFSQSKVAGYNDIIYPSAWNYLGKAAYDPNDAFPDVQFTEKGGTLFWRGATSEGVSVDGTWKGMVRQRLIHLGSNLTAADTPTILMPHPSQPDAYTYRGVPAPELTRSLQMDVATVDRIARCGGRDCADEETQLRFAAKSEFQAHWRHKYLFDVDGAGFSGRFLPFLQSRSLPFKASLFREWSAPRLRPWLHFVPQDLRLHDVHATLAYFAGLRDVWNNEWILKPHDEEGEWIAEQGREWAGKALRKEDMEIYFFRLLLEWGRLTDDRRDEIGFQM